MRPYRRRLRRSFRIIFFVDITVLINKQHIHKIAVVIGLIGVGFIAC